MDARREADDGVPLFLGRVVGGSISDSLTEWLSAAINDGSKLCHDPRLNISSLVPTTPMQRQVASR